MKPVEHFGLDNSRSDKKRIYCRNCITEKMQKNPRKQLTKFRQDEVIRKREMRRRNYHAGDSEIIRYIIDRLEMQKIPPEEFKKKIHGRGINLGLDIAIEIVRNSEITKG